MRKLYFWKEWHSPYKKLYWLFLSLFTIAFLSAAYNYLTGEGQVIHWETISTLDQLKIVALVVNAGAFKFEIPVDNYLVFQYFQGSNLSIEALNAYIYLVFLVVAINLIMAVLTSVPKIWFYAGMGGFIGFAVLLNIDQIMLFGQTDKTALIIVLTLYLTAGYYFREINQSTSLTWRFVTFCILSILLGILMYLFAGVSDPFLYIANYGIFAPVIISVLFIIFVAHEIIYGFLYLITNTNTVGSRHSLHHFIFISLFFLAYVWVTYMYYSRQIRWDMVYLNPFLLAGITFIIGIWGYRKREDLFKEIFGFYPIGALFYLGFGIIALATLSFIFSGANDPLMETFEDVILYSQIGFGMIFFIYVITNFGPLLLQNMKVSAIVYQSRVFPFFVFRIGGLLVFGYIFYSSNFLPYYQSMAGYYNFLGDIFLIEKELDLAEEYYGEASKYEFQNHRSNYAMATLARMKDDQYDEAYYFSNALLKQPSAYSVINLSNIYLRNDQYFDGLFQLKDGLETFPASYHILNNLGYYYSRTDISDSSFFYFDLSDRLSWNSKVPAVNIYALLAKTKVDIPLDTLQEDYDVGRSYAGLANQLAMVNQAGTSENTTAFPEIFENYKRDYFAYLYNTGVSRLRSPGATYYDDLLAYSDSSGSDFYRSRITILSALSKYINHQVTESFRLLYEMGEMAVLNDEYFNILGILAMDVKSPRLAVGYFSRTSTQVNEKYRLNLGVAYAEAGMLEEAKAVFASLIESADADIRVVSQKYFHILGLDLQRNMDSLNDEQKYLMYHYVYRTAGLAPSDSLTGAIENDIIRSLIRIEYIEDLLQNGKYQPAFYEFQRIDLNTLPSDLMVRLNKIRYAFSIHDVEDYAGISAQGTMQTNDPLYLYDLLLHLKKSQDLKDTTFLDPVYQKMASWNPFFEEGLIASVQYFKDIRAKDNYAYNLLVNGLNVNQYSVVLNKYYVDYCIQEGLLDFAKNRLEFMKGFMKGEDFTVYYYSAQNEITKKEADIFSWQ